MKFMPDPVSTATVGVTRRWSSSTWYSCHTHPTYTPVEASLVSCRLFLPSCMCTCISLQKLYLKLGLVNACQNAGT